ncbi:MAG: PilZ domain-containing protein [Nitrospiraceae bacterium]
MELRQHPRIPVDLRISFATSDNAGVRQGTMYNLSLGGCAVESTTMVQAGTDLTLSIHSPYQDVPIGIELAAVRWTVLGEFGLEFLKIPEHTKGRLERLVRNAQGSSSSTGE